MVRNPRAKSNRVLGYDDTRWANLLAKVREYLDRHSDQQEVSDTEVRALDPALSDARTWNQMLQEL